MHSFTRWGSMECGGPTASADASTRGGGGSVPTVGSADAGCGSSHRRRIRSRRPCIHRRQRIPTPAVEHPQPVGAAVAAGLRGKPASHGSHRLHLAARPARRGRRRLGLDANTTASYSGMRVPGCCGPAVTSSTASSSRHRTRGTGAAATATWTRLGFSKGGATPLHFIHSRMDLVRRSDQRLRVR